MEEVPAQEQYRYEPMRTRSLQRLKHKRYAEEVAQSLHDKKKGKKKAKRGKKQSPPSRQQSLFDSED